MQSSPELKQLAAAVAVWMLPPWRYDARERGEYDDPRILGPDGLALNFRNSWNHKGMATISGHDTHGQSINCSMTREPRAIAADIKRRLLADYIKAFELRQQESAERKAIDDELELIIECFERLGMVRNTYQHNRDGLRDSAERFGSDLSVEVQGYSTHRANVSFTTNPETALKVVGFIQSLKEITEHDDGENEV